MRPGAYCALKEPDASADAISNRCLSVACQSEGISSTPPRPCSASTQLSVVSQFLQEIGKRVPGIHKRLERVCTSSVYKITACSCNPLNETRPNQLSLTPRRKDAKTQRNLHKNLPSGR